MSAPQVVVFKSGSHSLISSADNNIDDEFDKLLSIRTIVSYYHVLKGNKSILSCGQTETKNLKLGDCLNNQPDLKRKAISMISQQLEESQFTLKFERMTKFFGIYLKENKGLT